MGLRELTPWYVRVAGKVVLSRVPVSYQAWRALRLFAHGEMAKSAYAYGVFRQHYDASTFPRKPGGFVALEIGPGDGLLSAVIAAACGAAKCYLVDTGKYATTDIAPYREIAQLLTSEGLAPPDLSGAQDLEAILRRCNATYLTDGLTSLRELPTHSVDFAWSHAVLEHIRHHEFAAGVRELRRILVPHGCVSHQVDLKDHLGGGLNHLRFPSRWWEAEWMVRSGFYTNRIRFSEMMRDFAAEGFSVERLVTSRFDSLPLPRRALAEEFRGVSDEDLMVSAFHAVLRTPGPSADGVTLESP
jgi:SAM-dependent methyltransferase